MAQLYHVIGRRGLVIQEIIGTSLELYNGGSENITVSTHEEYMGDNMAVKNMHVIEAFEKQISVNIDDKDNNKACQHARELVRYIMSKSSNIEPRLKMEIIESGSYFSNLRIGKPYEFDFMIDITSTLYDGYTVKQEQIESKIKGAPSEYFYKVFPKDTECIFMNDSQKAESHKEESGEIVSLSAEGVKKLIFDIFSKIADSEDCKRNWKIHRYSKNNSIGGAAFQISLFFKDTAMLIDLVPCLRFPKDNPESSIPALQYSTELLIKALIGDEYRKYIQELPHKLYLVCKSEVEDLFRLSTSQIERDIYLNQLDKKYLRALKLAKYYFQMFFIGLLACGEGEWERQWYRYALKDNHTDPFGSKSTVPSYAITNLFLHFLKLFVCNGYLSGKYPGEIVILFLKFVLNIIGNRSIVSDIKFTRLKTWTNLYICIYGWCFCGTNSITINLHGEAEFTCFNNSMSKYIQVVQNLSRDWELCQFPAIGHRPQIVCVDCYGKKLASEVWKSFDPAYITFGCCPLHSWSDGTLLLPYIIRQPKIIEGL